MEESKSLLERVYKCDACPEAYGFARPGSGEPYYKFPPMVGAQGSADLLFVGINPRRWGNFALFDRVMASPQAFMEFARNRDGGHAYIAPNGPEPHYWSHMKIVSGVYGCDASFEDHAAVTELFFCASRDSKHLPETGSDCADEYFEDVLKLVRPKAVVCVGKRADGYVRANYGGVIARAGTGLLRIRHPAAGATDQEAAIEAAIVAIRSIIQEGAGGMWNAVFR